MEITYFGGGAVKIAGKDVSMVMDPVDEPHGKMGKTAHIVTVSRPNPAYNNLKEATGEPIIIDGPGEYEVRGVAITGTSSGKNTIYTFEIEGVKICHLGNLGENLNDGQLEEIGNVDVLLVPIDKDRALDAETAEKIVSEIEPKIVIPIKSEKGSDELSKFIKEVGVAEPKHESKLKLAKKDLPAEEMHLFVLEKTAA